VSELFMIHYDGKPLHQIEMPYTGSIGKRPHVTRGNANIALGNIKSKLRYWEKYEDKTGFDLDKFEVVRYVPESVKCNE